MTMKAFTLRLDEKDYQQVRALAFVRESTITDVVREAINDYVQRQMEHAEFRAALARVWEENAQLISELAKY